MPPAGNQRERIARLEARLLDVESRVRNIPDRVGQRLASRQLRLARTAEWAASYPAAPTGGAAPANQYGIIFLDGTFDEAADGDEAATYQDRSGDARVVAHNVAASPVYVPEDTEIVVRSDGNGRWWFDLGYPGQAAAITFTLDVDLADTDATVDVTVTAFRRGTDPDEAAAGLTIKNELEFSGDSGDEGYAEWDGSDYLIYALETETIRWIKFNLDTALLDTDLTKSVTVLSFVGPDPGTTVTVKNAMGFEGDLNADGYAVWDGTDYVIFQLPCPSS